jgi:hypothetical protein
MIDYAETSWHAPMNLLRASQFDAVVPGSDPRI